MNAIFINICLLVVVLIFVSHTPSAKCFILPTMERNFLYPKNRFPIESLADAAPVEPPTYFTNAGPIESHPVASFREPFAAVPQSVSTFGADHFPHRSNGIFILRPSMLSATNNLEQPGVEKPISSLSPLMKRLLFDNSYKPLYRRHQNINAIDESDESSPLSNHYSGCRHHLSHHHRHHWHNIRGIKGEINVKWSVMPIWGGRHNEKQNQNEVVENDDSVRTPISSPHNQNREWSFASLRLRAPPPPPRLPFQLPVFPAPSSSQLTPQTALSQAEQQQQPLTEETKSVYADEILLAYANGKNLTKHRDRRQTSNRNRSTQSGGLNQFLMNATGMLNNFSRQITRQFSDATGSVNGMLQTIQDGFRRFANVNIFKARPERSFRKS